MNRLTTRSVNVLAVVVGLVGVAVFFLAPESREWGAVSGLILGIAMMSFRRK